MMKVVIWERKLNIYEENIDTDNDCNCKKKEKIKIRSREID